MDREWARKMLEEGHKVTKVYWEPDEYLFMTESTIYDEDGDVVDMCQYLEGDWKLYKESESLESPVDPKHYNDQGYNPIEVIESVFLNICQTGFDEELDDEQKKILLAALNSSFALKYFTRLGRKDEVMQELGKAENYTHRALHGTWKN